MKKVIVLLLAALIAVVSAFAMTAEPQEEVQEIYLVSGEIVEVNEGSLLMNSGDAGMFQVNITDETIIESETELAAGDYIHVDYNGMMTRSIPAQITAQLIRCYALEGSVSELIADENAVMLETETHGPVYVHLPEGFEDEIAAGDHVRIYFNGVMTMSLPGQVNADKVVPVEGDA